MPALMIRDYDRTVPPQNAVLFQFMQSEVFSARTPEDNQRISEWLYRLLAQRLMTDAEVRWLSQVAYDLTRPGRKVGYPNTRHVV